ncbi:SDR family oxidoreductase [Spirosoma humi]
MQIVVIGATGMLGQPVTHELMRAGSPIRIIARDVRKTCQLFPKATVVPGDLNSVNSLVRALREIGSVYLNLSIRQDEEKDHFHTKAQGLLNLIQAKQSTTTRKFSRLPGPGPIWVSPALRWTNLPPGSRRSVVSDQCMGKLLTFPPATSSTLC